MIAPEAKAPAKAGKCAPQRAAQLPEPLRRRSSHDDRLILLAFWQAFQEQAPALGGDHPRPDPAFFAVSRVIYAASHDPHADLFSQAALPYASLYLLRKYLEMHPRLREALSKALLRGAGSMKWNPTTILHRMQVVIATFLRYHGWAVSRPLQVYPAMASWEGRGPRDFAVEAQIRPELLMELGDGIVPGPDEAQQAEEALAWVLWALFAYAEDLGLKRAVFW